MADGNPRIPGIRVLVAVADLAAGYELASGLRGMGYAVARADSGFGAVEACQAFSPRVVLMDLQLPLLRGHEAAARIRFMGGIAPPCIVALYDALNPQQIDQSGSEVFDLRVAYPCPIQDIHHAIMACLTIEPRGL